MDVTLSAFADELEKISQWETARLGWKAAKGALFGGTKLKAAPGVFHAERQAATRAGKSLMEGLGESGVKVHRARVKTPGSIAANRSTAVPDDLLGLQAYGKSPADVERVLGALRARGVEVAKVSPHARPGYHGVNIKGTYRGTPMEMQVSPGRLSNMGQMMEHSLGYKPATEAPLSTFIDRWVGKHVAPRMVRARSWVPQYAAT